MDSFQTGLPVPRRSFYTVYIKRVLDVVLSASAIAILSPVLAITAAGVYIYHGKPILFTQERTGLHGQTFKIFKFRSMTNDRDEHGNLLPEEDRITPFGRLIRRLSIDELPELFCIITGDMSIVGPRPLLTKYLPLYSERHAMRHEVKPGLACVPLQSITTWSWNDQFENDIWYVENCSFLVDLRMVVAIVKEAIKGSEYRVTGVREEFTGDNLEVDAKA